MGDGNYDRLLDAIARSAGAVLSLPKGGGGLGHYKSRFLAESPAGFWVAAAAGEHRLIESLIGSQQPAGISFRDGHLKVVFASPIQKRDPLYRVNTASSVDALLLSFPSEVKAVQRRTSYRVSVPEGSDITARVWRIPPEAHLPARPLAAQELACALRDLSAAGIGLTFRGAGGQPPAVTVADRLRIELTCSAGKLLLEGRMRYPVEPPREEVVRAGVQFQPLPDSKAGRHAKAQLTRIVGELQREEVRRVRLGLCKAG
jgi:c-di-GMP-binding flagellar brake protein YcgR